MSVPRYYEDDLRWVTSKMACRRLVKVLDEHGISRDDLEAVEGIYRKVCMPWAAHVLVGRLLRRHAGAFDIIHGANPVTRLTEQRCRDRWLVGLVRTIELASARVMVSS